MNTPVSLNPYAIITIAFALAFAALTVNAETRVDVELSGDQQVPPVSTQGSGSGTLVVAEDKSVSGSFVTENVAGTMAHIHKAPAGDTGGVVIPLEQKGDNTWVVPEGAQLSDEDYQSFRAGELYVNVHTEANPAGEVRGQIVP